MDKQDKPIQVRVFDTEKKTAVTTSYKKMGDVSDGYHTFDELYKQRLLYNAGFFNAYHRYFGNVVKSRKHSDGELCFGGGWFIVVTQLPTGQISQHYEEKYWDLFKVNEGEKAPDYDGHTPDEAADRLEKYLLGDWGDAQSKK